ncbi:MAG TPA: hypothetical protein VMD76_08065, partial [Candidatus Sulfotelmatobacter sp.]|nr:hypothetical protein [Candidatus Sulfotelmatobacter sp.]
MLIGVETVRANGKPTVVNSGTTSNTPTATACNPKEVSVSQLRRERFAHEFSSKLSANIASSNAACFTMVSSSTYLLAAMDTAKIVPAR